LIDQRGRHRLWEVQTSGYFQVVDRIGSVTADRTDLANASQAFMNSDLAARDIYPAVAFDGRTAAPPTVPGPNPPFGSPGLIVTQSEAKADGVFKSTVQADRAATILLKVSYDPRWTVTVDGVSRRPVMMAPSLVGVDVPAGRHEVEFRYVPYSHYPQLFCIGLITLSTLALLPRRRLKNRLRRVLRLS
jgi:hypothetical protein